MFGFSSSIVHYKPYVFSCTNLHSNKLVLTSALSVKQCCERMDKVGYILGKKCKCKQHKARASKTKNYVLL
jgi:hypothetical protein